MPVVSSGKVFGPWNKHWEHWDESLLIKWLCVDDINCWVVILQGIVCLMFMIVGLIDWVDFSAVTKYLIIIHQPRVSFFSWTPIYGIQISSFFFHFLVQNNQFFLNLFLKIIFSNFCYFYNMLLQMDSCSYYWHSCLPRKEKNSNHLPLTDIIVAISYTYALLLVHLPLPLSVWPSMRRWEMKNFNVKIH